jgi:formylglycine-generating enzyme required for sulfatase activity
MHRNGILRLEFMVPFLIMVSCVSPTAPPSSPPPLTDIAVASPSAEPPSPTTHADILTSVRSHDGVTMSFVPAGAFIMGSDSGETNEGPAHEVVLDAYWIDQTEITNRMYAMCVASAGCQPPMEAGSETRRTYYEDDRYAEYPVLHVDWGMASAYCTWAEARLPTEAEWEKAARGLDGRIYPWGDEWDVHSRRRLNFSDVNDPHGGSDPEANDGFAETAPVASFEAGRSAYGVSDMAGNVWEWVADWYAADYYSHSPTNNPAGPASGEMRSLRGGSWVASQLVFRTFNRNGLDPTRSATGLGFRCAQDVSS